MANEDKPTADAGTEERAERKTHTYSEQLNKFIRVVQKKSILLSIENRRSRVSNIDVYKALWHYSGATMPRERVKKHALRRRLAAEVRVRNYRQRDEIKANLMAIVAAGVSDTARHPQGEASEVQEDDEQSMDIDPSSHSSKSGNTADMRSVRSGSRASSVVPMSVIEGGSRLRRSTTSSFDMASVDLSEEKSESMDSGSITEPVKEKDEDFEEDPDLDETLYGMEGPDSEDSNSDSNSSGGTSDTGKSASNTGDAPEDSNKNTLETDTIPQAADEGPQDPDEGPQDPDEGPQDPDEGPQDPDEVSQGADAMSQDAEKTPSDAEKTSSDAENTSSDAENVSSDTEKTASENGKNASCVSMSIGKTASDNSEHTSDTTSECTSIIKDDYSGASTEAVYEGSSRGSNEDAGSFPEESGSEFELTLQLSPDEEDSRTDPWNSLEAVVERFKEAAIRSKKKGSPKRKATEVEVEEGPHDRAESYVSPRKKRSSGTPPGTSSVSPKRIRPARRRSNSEPAAGTLDEGESSTSLRPSFPRTSDQGADLLNVDADFGEEAPEL